MAKINKFIGGALEKNFSSIHLQETKDLIRKEIRNKSGIYGFICNKDDKMYIGSSVSLSDRFNKHLDGSRSNIILQRAIKAHSLSNFKFVIFEFCDNDKLISREDFYLKTLGPEYNIMTEAGSSLNYEHTPEAKLLMSGENHHSFNKPRSEEVREKISETMKDRSLSDSHRVNISESLKDKFTGENNPFFGQTHSEETKKAISLALSGEKHYNYGNISKNAKKIFIYSLDYKLLEECSSISKAADWLKTDRNSVRKNISKIFKDKFIISDVIIKKLPLSF